MSVLVKFVVATAAPSKNKRMKFAFTILYVYVFTPTHIHLVNTTKKKHDVLIECNGI